MTPRGLPAWWRGLSSPDKFRLYMRLALHAAILSIVLSLLVSGTGAWPTLGIAVVGLAAIAGIEAQPDLSLRMSPRQRRIAWYFAIAGVTVVWLVSVTIARAGGVAKGASTDAGVVAVLTYCLAACAVLPFLRLRWWLLLGGAAATALMVSDRPAQLGAVLFALGLFLMWTARTTVWSLQVLTELEESKHVAAELRVAQERLRFSRDLHDVVGRAFSAIAVKSELAATLARAGAAERAAAEMDEVKALAASSMEDTRSLVRGYRGIDLGTEVAGARSLLSAAGCELRVIGEPHAVPAALHEAAAWVVREGTTNIVKHSSATQAVLTLVPSGLVLRNDGALGPAGAPSGIDGLRGRLRAVGADLDGAREGTEFVLTATWEAP